jgi:hypothetical protein
VTGRLATAEDSTGRAQDVPAAQRRLRVEIVFDGIDERQAQAVAAQMIGRAHELANLPESECDVDVSVEETAAENVFERPDADSAARAPARGRPAAR